MFDQLPLNEQNSLLSYRWDKIGNAAMLPILRQYAQSYHDFPEMREANAYSSLQLSASALQSWYELDPAGARPGIIAEISRTRPRFGARVLGILPDGVLAKPVADCRCARKKSDEGMEKDEGAVRTDVYRRLVTLFFAFERC
jgi:hypothetical protein